MVITKRIYSLLSPLFVLLKIPCPVLALRMFEVVLLFYIVPILYNIKEKDP